MDACCAHGRFEDASRLYETTDGRQIVVPMVRRRALGRRLATAWSMPDGWGLGGAVGSAPVGPEDVALVVDDLRSVSPRVIVKPGPLTGGAWNGAAAQERVPHTMHVIDLRHGLEALWSKRFSGRTRNKIRKAEKDGVEIQCGAGTELVKLYWDIYLRWTLGRAERRGIPGGIALASAKRRESLERFEAVARCLDERCQVLVAWIGGRPAASIILLLDGAYAHYWRAASDQALIGQRYANYLLLARAIEAAAERGYEHMDLGESGGVRSLMAFKEQFGAEPVSHEELRFEPRVVTKAVRARNRFVQAASDVTLRSLARARSSSALGLARDR
jgi:hypothetical protein